MMLTNPQRGTLSQLAYKQAEHSAAKDGALLWDAGLSAPVVSRSGAFPRLAVQVDVPATATSAGQPGDYAVNTTHLYVCVAANAWRRVAVAAW